MRRRIYAWKFDDTIMFMIVVVWWYFYDVGPHSFCHLTPSCPITLSDISRRWCHKRFMFCAIWCPGHIFYNQKNDSITGKALKSKQTCNTTIIRWKNVNAKTWWPKQWWWRCWYSCWSLESVSAHRGGILLLIWTFHMQIGLCSGSTQCHGSYNVARRRICRT